MLSKKGDPALLLWQVRTLLSSHVFCAMKNTGLEFR